MANAVAIIPARGGSKRIPRKNIKDFCGKPIIAYSIAAAFASKCFDEVMVSTDDDEIAEVAEEYGAEVPFRRSQKTSDDFATMIDVMTEVLTEYKARGRNFYTYACILPTAPTIRAERIRQAYEKLMDSGADSLIAVTKFGYPIQRAFEINDDGLLRMMWPENLLKRSQDLAPAYMDAGQFYWGKVSALLDKRLILTENTIAMPIPESEAQDVDTIEDWKIAEFKYKLFQETVD